MLLDDDGRAAPLEGQRDEAVVRSAGLTPDAIGAVLDATAPDPVAARNAALDPEARYAAVVSDESSVTSAPG